MLSTKQVYLMSPSHSINKILPSLNIFHVFIMSSSCLYLCHLCISTRHLWFLHHALAPGVDLTLLRVAEPTKCLLRLDEPGAPMRSVSLCVSFLHIIFNIVLQHRFHMFPYVSMNVVSNMSSTTCRLHLRTDSHRDGTLGSRLTGTIPEF